ncbi:MAG: hypothetical protein HY897_20730 [Deltaproteobacteria bacterium]|nr:hypothetical protein [Deltaproteobacteria bacterium]
MAALTLAAIIPGSAEAHETLHEVVRGKAIAVKAFVGDGEALAYTEYEVFSPGDPKTPHQKGRTDRAGFLSFVPDAAGKWRVRVIEKGGHGIDIEIEAGPGPASDQKEGTAHMHAWVRPLLGLAIIAVIFAGLYLLGRKKRASS